jgi:hypothetical protein
MLLGADFLAGQFALPKALLRNAGVILLPYSALVACVGARDRVSGSPVDWFGIVDVAVLRK